MNALWHVLTPDYFRFHQCTPNKWADLIQTFHGTATPGLWGVYESEADATACAKQMWLDEKEYTSRLYDESRHAVGHEMPVAIRQDLEDRKARADAALRLLN